MIYLETYDKTKAIILKKNVYTVAIVSTIVGGLVLLMIERSIYLRNDSLVQPSAKGDIVQGDKLTFFEIIHNYFFSTKDTRNEKDMLPSENILSNTPIKQSDPIVEPVVTVLQKTNSDVIDEATSVVIASSVSESKNISQESKSFVSKKDQLQ
jgi:hypothetical protein